MRSDKAMCLFDLLALGSIGSVLDIVVVRIQNLIRYMANTGFSDAKNWFANRIEKPVLSVFSIPVHNPSCECSG